MPRPPRTRIDRPPSSLRLTGTPIITVLIGSMAPLLPMIASTPLVPPFGLIMLIAWRLRHRTIWPAWIGLPLGLWDDIFSGQPLGSSMLLWTVVLLGLEMIDRRMVWRDFWQDWGLAAVIITATVLGALAIANVTGGNTSAIVMLPQIIVSIALFPLLARGCAMIDAWRLLRMNTTKRIVTEAQQNFSFTRRALVLGGAQVAIGAVLAGRMAYISIAQNERYSLLAESNRVNLTLMPPRRGWIVDRIGRPLALNRTAFRIDIIPDRIRDKPRVLGELQKLLALPDDEIQRISTEISKNAGYQPVQVAQNLSWDQFAAVSIRAPELPGVAPGQSFNRYYPTGAAVGHLLGYVGAASAKDYEIAKDPLLILPGFKIGKDGLEKVMEPKLRGEPGAKRTEVTAGGKLVRDLATRADVPGKTIRLTVDAGLQEYAARRLGNESGSVVVIDCLNGGILTMASMPSYDPNSFSDGLGNNEWKMLQADDHIPMLNKSLQGLYPPGSTVKPMAGLAVLRAGIDPKETVFCGGGYRLGNRTFKCLGRHGSVNMTTAIMKSCNTYFYAMANRLGYDSIAPVAKMTGLGQEFDLPVASQRYGTVPDSAWKMRKYNKEWSRSDSLNATIGQGYIIVSPLQLAVMSARIASGRNLMPSLIVGQQPLAAALPFPAEHLAVVRQGMNLVVNGGGTGARSRLPLEGIAMAGKTGTAQVRKIAGSQRGQSGEWKYRDHGLFVCFAPVEAPRYAAAVVIEHGLGGARAAAPVARDVLTYLYDQQKAMATLEALESGWGGTIKQRMDRKSLAWAQANGLAPPPSPSPPVEDVSANTTKAQTPAPAPIDAATVQPATEPATNLTAPVPSVDATNATGATE